MIPAESLRIEVRLFAAAADIAGCRRLAIELSPGDSLVELRRKVASAHSELSALVKASRWAVGTEFVADSFAFTNSQEVAMIPPVSGG